MTVMNTLTSFLLGMASTLFFVLALLVAKNALG
jgi:hypothetical protein